MYNRAQYKEEKELAWHTLPAPYATPKFDGAHFYLEVQPDGSLKYYSRRQSVHGHFPERSSQLPHLTDKKFPEFAGHVFSVELIHTGKNKNAKEDNTVVAGILNSLPPKSIETQQNIGPVRAALLDVINPSLQTYGDKINHMKKFEEAFNKPDVMFVPKGETTKEGISKLIDRTRWEGKEGVIVTSLTQPEINNPRIKIKHFYTFNLRVASIQQEFDINGKSKPSMGALNCEDSTGRLVATVGTGFSKELRKEIWDNPYEWIGKLITVKTFGLASLGGKLRAPVYNGLADGSIDKV